MDIARWLPTKYGRSKYVILVIHHISVGSERVRRREPRVDGNSPGEITLRALGLP